MAHFARILNANSLKSKFCCYKELKALKLSVNERTPWEGSSNSLKTIIYPEIFRTLKKRIVTPNTIENVVWKSFLGFSGGIILTYILFIFFYIGLGFTPRVSTYMCVMLEVTLSLGLAFSESARCYLLLVLPVLFLQQGREGLLAFIIFLAITGPGKTTMQNMNILTITMNCRQEVIGKTLIQIIEMGSTPCKSVKETIQELTKTVQGASEKVKSSIVNIKRPIIGILNSIMKATYWLRNIVDLCNKKVGSPFQRCMRKFEDSIADCKAKLGIMDFLCHVVHTVKSLCYSVKNLDFLCSYTEFVSDELTRVVKMRMKEFSLKMKNLFYVSIDFGHSVHIPTFAFNFTANSNETHLQKLNALMENVELAYIFFIAFVTFFLIYVCLKVYYYKYKYLSSDQFDNLYINKYIIELDLRRSLMDRETVLPLNSREKRYFAKSTSMRLLQKEKLRMTKSICLLSLTTIKIITFMMLDYSLFWTLSIIYNAGYKEFERVEKPEVFLHVEGEGILADFFRNLAKTFQMSETSEEPMNSLKCLPDPSEPDRKRYMQIGFFLAVCWIFTLTEAYGLRVRNVVMSFYYPDRARERAVWLYNHILFSRGTFAKFARKKLKKTPDKDKKRCSGKVNMGHQLLTLILNIPILRHFLLRRMDNACLSCGTYETKAEPLKRCKTPKCPGKYCTPCFVSLQNLCMICQKPIDEEDFLDMGDEGDSSEEERYVRSIRESGKEDKFSSLKTEAESRKARKDYARLSDLDSQKMDLKKRAKSAILKRIRSLVRKKKQKDADKRIKSKVEDLERKLSESKSLTPIAKQKVLDELYKIKQEELEREETESLFTGVDNESSSIIVSSITVSNTQKPFPLPESKADYEKLKNEVRDRIKFLKGQKGNTLSCLPESEKKSADKDKSSAKNTSEERIVWSMGGQGSRLGVPSSLSKFWESKSAKFGFADVESEWNFPDYSTLNSESQGSSFPPEIRFYKSGSDERWQSEKKISDASFDDKFVYYLVEKEKNVDILVKDALEVQARFDVNFKTFAGEEYEESEEDFNL